MPVEFKHATLPNGLSIVAEVDPAAHTAGIGFYVKTGARDESPALMGVSHFLEHMIFKGTDRRSAADVDRDFDDIGADHNAFTSDEMTAFFAHCLPEHLDRATEILADIMRPALRPKDFDDEKSVIIEEIAMYDDQPFWVLYERALEEYYRDHPLGHRVLGTRGTIEAMQREQMLSYFEQRYSADNTTVALAGRLDFDKAVERIAEYCGDWKTTDARRRYDPVAPAAEPLTIDSESVSQHYGIMITPAPPVQDERRYAAGVLAHVLGDVDGSRLYWALVETGLAEEAQAQYKGRDRDGAYLVYFACAAQDAETVVRVIDEQIDGLAGSLTDDDLTRVRSKLATTVTLQGELPAGRMHRLGRLWTYLGEYRSLEAELDRLNAVTLDDLRAIFEAFPFQPRLIARLRPANQTASDSRPRTEG